MTEMMSKKAADLVHVFSRQDWETPRFQAGVFSFVKKGSYGKEDILYATETLREILPDVVAAVGWPKEEWASIVDEFNEIITAYNKAKLRDLGKVLDRQVIEQTEFGFLGSSRNIRTVHQAKVEFNDTHFGQDTTYLPGEVAWINCEPDQELI